MSSETKSRSLIKAISYRAVSSLVTAGIVFSVTQLGWLAIVVALFDSVVKTVTYFLHERIWTFIKFGRIRHPLEDLQI